MDRIDGQSYPLDRSETAPLETREPDVRRPPRKLRVFSIRVTSADGTPRSH